MKHAIELVPDTTPVIDRHLPVSPAVQQLIYEEIDERLRLEVIEESDSPWSNTITLGKKPRKNRLCLDAQSEHHQGCISAAEHRGNFGQDKHEQMYI